MCSNQEGDIFILNYGSLKLVDKFTYIGSSVSSTESDDNMCLGKTCTAIDRLSIIWKSDLSVRLKRNFFQAAVMLILLYGYTTWTVTKRIEKKQDGNCTRMLRAKPGINIPQSSCTATYFPPLKSSKYDEQGMRDTAGEARTNL